MASWKTLPKNYFSDLALSLLLLKPMDSFIWKSSLCPSATSRALFFILTPVDIDVFLLHFEIASSFVDDQLVDTEVTKIFFYFAYERAGTKQKYGHCWLTKMKYRLKNWTPNTLQFSQFNLQPNRFTLHFTLDVYVLCIILGLLFSKLQLLDIFPNINFLMPILFMPFRKISLITLSFINSYKIIE